MSQEQDKKLYDTLTRTGELLKSVAPVEGEEYSLDAILAEFGKGGAKPAQNTPKADVKTAHVEKSPSPAPVASTDDTIPLPDLWDVPHAEKKPAPTPKMEPKTPAEEEFTPPDRVSLKDLMQDTVESVLAANDDGILEPHRSLSQRLRAAIPSRRKHYEPQDTEELWSQAQPEPEEEPEPEPEPEDAYRTQKRRSKHLRRGVTSLAIPAVLAVIITVLDALEYLPEAYWAQNNMIHGGVLGGLAALSLVLGLDLWRSAIEQLQMRHGSWELGAIAVAAVNCAYSVYGMFYGFIAGEPFTAAVCVMLWLCQEGLYLSSESRHTAYALINMGGTPPYTVSATEVGVCKQKGTLSGFYRLSEKPDLSRMVQNYAVPMLLAVATVLAGVICLSGDSMERFLWVWCAMLTAAVPMSLPLTGTLPLYRLQKRLRSGGSAVAGWWGAKGMQAKKRLVLTEKDIFPPGTVEFNGYKVFGEERSKMISYAATVAHCAHSQLTDLFAQQLAAEGGFRYTMENLQFYEEGGVGGTIRGESVLMGSAYFMRKMHVSLPHDLKLQTGVFLAIDGVLGAIFVIKYQPSRNVEWALRAMLRARIRPVLAVRSGNVTPGLLKRKFRLDVRPVYPDVITRVALSDTMENVGETANAVLYREGLMPLAETVIGSMRMRRMSRAMLVLCYVSAAAGLFLCYYFTRVGAYSALMPLYMLGFLLLWLVPTLLLSGTVKHF